MTGKIKIKCFTLLNLKITLAFIETNEFPFFPCDHVVNTYMSKVIP